METPDHLLREQITAAYAPLVALYQLFESRLRETPDDVPPVGWKPQLEALRALRDGEVAGDPVALGRLMTDPAALPPVPGLEDPVHAAIGTPHALLIRPYDPRTLLAIAEPLVAAGRRILLLAPAAESARTAIRALTPLTETPDPRGAAGPGLLMLVSEPDDAETETMVRRSRLVPCGEALVASWQAESKRLKRELLWLEQWPRDVAWLAGLQAEREEHLQGLAAEEERLAGRAAGLRDEAATAELEAVTARAARAGAAVELAGAEGIEAGLREEYEGFAAIADAASRVAADRSRAAEEAYERYRALKERYAAAEAELAQARDREAYLLRELPRARAALPAAERAVEVAEQAVTAAEAEGHASYYRLAATESALAAEKKTLTLGQRLRIVPARESTQALRQELAEKRREADGSAERIRRARAEHERARSYLAAVADIISNGDKELTAVRERQRQLVAELNRLAADREPARIEHENRARDAATALDEATEKGTTARLAEARLQEGAARLETARASAEEAASAVEETEARALHGREAADEAEAELERHRAVRTAALDRPSVELTDALEAEAGSRHHVAELCGDDPAAVGAERLAGLRDEAMARIEELAGLLEATDQEALLARASIVCVTPGSMAAHPLLRTAEFDTLIAVDAGGLTDGEFLLAATRTRHWIMLGGSDQAPPPPDAEFAAFLEALAELSAFSGDDAPDPSVTAPDLEPAPSPPGPDDRLSPEADRLRTSGLWESRYREAYTKAIDRLQRANPGTDAQRLLLSTLTDHLRTSAFHRALAAAPGLVSTLPEDVRDSWLPLEP
jgi:hypothetical protein